MNIGIKMFKWFLFSTLALIFTLNFIGSAGTSRIRDSVLSVLFVFQAIFIFVPEDTTLFRPIKRSSLVALVATSSAIMTVLVIALFFPMIHILVRMEYYFWRVFWAACCISWTAWSVFFFIRYKDMELYKAYRGLLSTIIKSALILLLLTMISFVIFPAQIHHFNLLEIVPNIGFTAGIVLLSQICPKILISAIFKQTKRVRT